MPVYVYECRSCEHRFEEQQSFSDDSLIDCPKAGCSGELYRVIQSSYALYKGPGFKTTEARGITGRKRKPNIKVGLKADLPPEQRRGME